MSYDLKCEMIAKKLLSLNYPPPIFVTFILVFYGLTSYLCVCLTFGFCFTASRSLKVYCDVFVWSIAEYSFSLHITNK